MPGTVEERVKVTVESSETELALKLFAETDPVSIMLIPLSKVLITMLE